MLVVVAVCLNSSIIITFGSFPTQFSQVGFIGFKHMLNHYFHASTHASKLVGIIMRLEKSHRVIYMIVIGLEHIEFLWCLLIIRLLIRNTIGL